MTSARCPSPTYCFALMLLAALAGCGKSNAPPTAKAITASIDEDTSLQSAVEAIDPEGDPITYSIVSLPAHGAVSIDARTGAFTYTPSPDFFGNDSFIASFRAKGGEGSAPVSIEIRNVPDPPRLQGIGPQANSADSRTTVIPVAAADPDHGQLTVTVTSSDDNVATAIYNPDTKAIEVTQVAGGTTSIAVSVSNASYTVDENFAFTVGEVSRGFSLSPQTLSTSAVELTNSSDLTVRLELMHNGFHANASISDMLAQLQTPSDPLPPEQFAKALWRYVRDNTIHSMMPSPQAWLYAPWATIRSFGFAPCSQIALTYVTMARAAQYEARVWEIYGHTVPEILVNGRWEMYDPDLGVYYLNRIGQVAGVEELIDDPSLIDDPEYMGMPMWPFPYSSEVAAIYGSKDDDYLIPNWLYDAAAFDDAPPLELPPGATLTYPGRWTGTPMQADGVTPLREFKQAALDLPAGWTGTILPPWALADIQGHGTVRINDTSYEAGSADLSALIAKTTTPLTEVSVTANDGIRFVFWCSLARMYMTAQTSVQVRSIDSWAIDAHSVSLPDGEAAAGPSASIKARMIEPQ